MAQEPAPVTFLSLARELRQNILIHSHNYEKDMDSWTFAEERAKGDELVAALEKAVEPTYCEILPDIQYAKTQWLIELRDTQRAVEAAGARLCTDREDEEVLWNITREGQAPWVRIHRKLYLMNRKWWYETAAGKKWLEKRDEIRETNGNRDYEAFGSLVDQHVHPPWDNHARCRSVLMNAVSVTAWVGPSGVEWCGPGYGRSGHPPSTWECAGQVQLSEAADRDLAWLQLQAEAYFRRNEQRQDD